MALFRQEADRRFNIGQSEIEAALRGDVAAPSAQQDETSTANEAVEEAKQNAVERNAFGIENPKSADKYQASLIVGRAAGNDGWVIGGGNGGSTNDETPEERERKKEDTANDALGEMVETSQQSLKREREEQLKKWQEQWDRAMSDEVDGLTNAEVLQSLRRINKNPRKAAEDAVRRGEIQQDDIPAYVRYMDLWKRNEEYKRNHNGQDNPELKDQMKEIDNTSDGRIGRSAEISVKDDHAAHATMVAAQTLGAGDGKITKSIDSRDDVREDAAPEIVAAARAAVKDDVITAQRESSSARTVMSSMGTGAIADDLDTGKSAPSDPILANPIQAQSPRDAFKTAAEGVAERPRLAVAVAPATAVKPEAMTI